MQEPRFIEIAEALSLYKVGEVPVLDVRSEKEFEKGHIPGAINIPLLNNEHRHLVGCCYKEQGQSKAVELGYSLVGPLFPEIQEKALQARSERQVILHCWRGGLRSKITAGLLAEVGFEVLMVEGGYKKWRNTWLLELEKIRDIKIVSGLTGSGKTGLLHALRDKGQQVIDLEGMAHHRGSAFGGLGLPEQPTQEQFENILCHALWLMKEGPLYVESESRMIGKMRIPDPFFNQMLLAPRIEVNRTNAFRREEILRIYGVFPIEELVEKTSQLSKRMGSEQTQEAVAALEAGDRVKWLDILLHYYDKNYVHHHEKIAQQKVNIALQCNDHDAEVVQEILALTWK
jgi:tRNA 2-selenouridine synthase